MTSDIGLPASVTPPEGDGMYDRMKRHQIEVLRDAGFSLREVARKADVSLYTVLRVLRESSSVERARRPVGRPPLAVPFEASVREALEERNDLPTVEILRRLRARGYDGGKNPVYEMARRLRKVVTPPLVRFEGLVGEFCQNDFGHVRVRYDDGTEALLPFFASRLKWSRWVYVELVP